MKMFMKAFRLTGDSKNYEVNFKRGLNFISGPTSTGKSTILELINYALGADSHKNYIEVREKCKDVEIEILLNDTLFRIRRKLFSPDLPILVEIYDIDSKSFVKNGVYYENPVDGQETLSDFLLSKIGLDGLTIANQRFSFRDLFKYSYLKQTEIDNEDIFNAEKNYILDIKRKATFEIVFSIYNNLIGELKVRLKEKKEELNNDRIKYNGISEFLKTADINDFNEIEINKNKIIEEIKNLKTQLLKIKSKSYEESENKYVKELNEIVRTNKLELIKLDKQLDNQKQYIKKLCQLSNQYDRDVEKIDAARVGINEINKYDFIYCPNCLKPIAKHEGMDCQLCGNEMNEVMENILLLKSERSSVIRKRNELDKHIKEQSVKKEFIEKEKKQLLEKIEINNRTINELTEQFINPYLEEISLINLKIGEKYKELDELENSLRFIKELNRLTILLEQKKKEVDDLNEQIKSKSAAVDKKDILHNLSNKFSDILQSFRFPKLSDSYINTTNYLPYVRGNKYNDIGSLGAVTLITMAYYLSIFIESKSPDFNHLNLLMIDTPRKNLGSSSTEKDFQDDEIYYAVIRYLIQICKDNENDIQLIIVNNGYPEFLPKEDLIIEFSSSGKNGLIDDI
ncbi:hypothetical protein M2475_000845 [Breznakia sp. PF5-3]|uniref:hypothetical protein n=1 Tax=unclassified Breznakia TaxID=2623764 RepID=UPI0024060E78|nr:MULTISPECIES: hypothetical protein [unclassified Breznakia]MDF9824494.1 hypothetical protein [Breznakia sp. PM6-1]MDF9835280.1 hypothetical protein [Breznakia sp. PF5-3]MDF9836996.1 hypothetical protein [Breznakia sp. PFB2-8]MDF9858921.1 hypothetical protein [Breznakia sp. PH5-24]